ncbi:ATP synthase subunit alpha [Escherichia coli]|uniref:ATP synthase subunit alpha n=1 Tax=Escherichia coli TaxID=562 RepID=A0A376L4X6_ECOLX|nr:ATP synthase subunit alpha [Escherichia coli]
MSVAQQSLVLFAAERGYLADVELSKIGSFEAALLAYVDRDHAPLMPRDQPDRWLQRRNRRQAERHPRFLQSNPILVTSGGLP